jgi:RNA polymerase sigma-54 factor
LQKKEIDVVFIPTTREREERFLPVRIPIMAGILGYRVFIIRKNEAEKFLKENIDNANQFINALNLRELVLYNTMYAIMDKQREYFLTGDKKKIKPMILKDIAEIVNLDISTISRVSNSKFVQTPFGTISLKNLFSESIGDENTSSREVKQILKEIIESEDMNKPLQDEEIKEILNQKGYNIARRTISKYRKQLHIPVARLRAKS